MRDELYRAVLACAERVSVHVFPPAVIDRDGLHRSNLRGLREALWACQPADVSLVDGFKLGPTAPPHRAVVDGDTKSAAIAAASIVAKVTRDRYMRAADAIYPGYGFASHVGYITPAHTKVVRERGPCEIHRRSWRARCVPATRARALTSQRSSPGLVTRGTTPSGAPPGGTGCAATGSSTRTCWLAGGELDIVARRGRRSSSAR